MALPRGRCWCCGNEFLLRVLRVVRYQNGRGRPYNLVCVTCQDNILHAKEQQDGETPIRP